MTQLTTETIAKSLASAKTTDNVNVFDSVKIINTEEAEVISVKKETDGITVFITANNEQVRTVSYLFKLEDIEKTNREAVLTEMLRESLSLPLVSFGMEGEEFVLFGSMSSNSGEDELIEEVEAIFSTSELVTNQVNDFVAA